LNVPCKDCELRTLGCHIKCERYKDWKIEREKHILKRYKEKKNKTAIDEVQYYGTNKARRK